MFYAAYFLLLPYLSFSFIVAIAALIYHVKDEKKSELNPFIVCLCSCVIIVSLIWIIDILLNGGNI